MKKMILALSLLTSLSSMASVQISSECLNVAKQNKDLEAQLKEIDTNVKAFSLNESTGYSKETGETLAKMACIPFIKQPAKAQINVCNEIAANIEANQIDQTQGYSLETASILNQMNGNICF